MANDVASPQQCEATARRHAGRPTQKGAAELEGLLVETATEEFLTHGYSVASLSRIVDRAHVSKTTLYSRYPSKEALFRAVIMHLPVVARPHDALPEPSPTIDIEESLRDYAYQMIDIGLQERHLNVNRLVLNESGRFPQLAQIASESTERGIDRIAKFITACADYRGIEIDDARGIAFGFIHMLRGWYFDVIMTRRSVADEERRWWARQASRTVTRSAPSW